MKAEEIERLMTQFTQSNLSEMNLSDGDFKLSLSKVATVAPVTQNPATTTPVARPEAINASADTPIPSPLVGIVYLAPNPDAEVFKQIGDSVAVGEVICLVEAMKMVNEIKSPVAGVVSDILVADGSLVEYDQPIMTIKEG